MCWATCAYMYMNMYTLTCSLETGVIGGIIIPAFPYMMKRLRNTFREP